MKEEKLVRCRPCGYVMKESELGDICPACGLPRSVFEPYREKVSADRLRFLGWDIHPIAIHLSQTFVALVPILIIFHYIFPNFQETIVHSVIAFSVYVFPFTLLLSFVSGMLDGIYRFKTLKTPLLKAKIFFGIVIIIFAILEVAIFRPGNYPWYFLLITMLSLVTAVRLGTLGKYLINVILPGSLVLRKERSAPRKKLTSGEIEKLKADKMAEKEKKTAFSN